VKTYYDLTNKEKKEYLKEFKQTPTGKDMNIVNISIQTIGFIFMILMLYYDFILSTYDSVVTVMFLISLLIEFLYSTYFNINFTAWLKNKHKIKRW